MTDLATALRTTLRQAMRQRDQVAISALRSAISALDNATAVPTDNVAGAIEEAAVGVGAAEAARRELSADQQRAVVQREIDERIDAARELPGPAADRVRAEADVLQRALHG